jgi:hypothetical protein
MSIAPGGGNEDWCSDGVMSCLLSAETTSLDRRRETPTPKTVTLPTWKLFVEVGHIHSGLPVDVAVLEMLIFVENHDFVHNQLQTGRLRCLEH